ncbi:MAG: hypothetical protein Q9182_006225 [Xanthomendoza sp. 2 TL-2023]
MLLALVCLLLAYPMIYVFRAAALPKPSRIQYARSFRSLFTHDAIKNAAEESPILVRMDLAANAVIAANIPTATQQSQDITLNRNGQGQAGVIPDLNITRTDVDFFDLSTRRDNKCWEELQLSTGGAELVRPTDLLRKRRVFLMLPKPSRLAGAGLYWHQDTGLHTSAATSTTSLRRSSKNPPRANSSSTTPTPAPKLENSGNTVSITVIAGKINTQCLSQLRILTWNMHCNDICDRTCEFVEEGAQGQEFFPCHG